jgi:hypothetical protein
VALRRAAAAWVRAVFGLVAVSAGDWVGFFVGTDALPDWKKRQSAVKKQASHFGVGALQILRPCQISQW